MATWRLAKSLEKLRSQVNALAPQRSKSSDGTIGDQAHSNRKSEHNPNTAGVVRALDLTHDPAGGFDSYRFAELLRRSADPRILYIISNGKIANTGKDWRKYTGTNPHSRHVHISVEAKAALYDDARAWVLNGDVAPAPRLIIEPIVSHPFLRNGSRGDDVVKLQRLLKIKDDGIFGDKTEAAVKKFQRANKLVPDGIVGPYTWAVLKS